MFTNFTRAVDAKDAKLEPPLHKHSENDDSDSLRVNSICKSNNLFLNGNENNAAPRAIEQAMRSLIQNHEIQ